VIGRYRIYPKWFGASEKAPMQELAEREAKRLGLAVTSIEIVSAGDDLRGPYLNFDVAYSAIQPLEKSS
jgi:hypothetical protein